MKRLVPVTVFFVLLLAVYFMARPRKGEGIKSTHRESTSKPMEIAVAEVQPTPRSMEASTSPEPANLASSSSVTGKAVDVKPQTIQSGGTPGMAKNGKTETPAPNALGERDSLIDELDNVQFAIRDYRDGIGENPTGSNLEITKALMGDNARQLKVPLPVGSHVNEKGELSDRWGTAYFFHQLSASEMEVRSAGPDQRMWTTDDLVTK